MVGNSNGEFEHDRSVRAVKSLYSSSFATGVQCLETSLEGLDAERSEPKPKALGEDVYGGIDQNSGYLASDMVEIGLNILSRVLSP